MYVGFNNDAWLYRQIPLAPMEWEDPAVRLQVASPLGSILFELGQLSTDFGTGLRTLARNRSFHLVSIIWEGPAVHPESTPEPLRRYLEETLTFPVPRKTLLLGVRLLPKLSADAAERGVVAGAKELITGAFGQDVPKRERYAEDIERIDSIVLKYGGRIPPSESLRQLEAWYSNGQEPSEVLFEGEDRIIVDATNERLEMAAVRAFTQPMLQAPDAPWLLDATTHAAGAHVVSIRGELEPSRVARSRMRQAQRKVLAQMEEEAATGDLDRAENSITYNLAQQVEDEFTGSDAPLLTGCSVVLGRRVGPGEFDTYIDMLRASYGIEVEPLKLRQLAALGETLPCSPTRVNPFVQELNVAMVAHAGMQGFSTLGDASGVFVGLCDPDYAPVYLDPSAAPRQNLPPSMGVFGDPGSGKTFLMQMIATQSVLAGKQVFFINPKGFDSLASFAHYVGGRVVRMSQLEATGGFFDPFRYAEPEIAAEIASAHINLVLGGERGFTGEQELHLEAGLKAGARAGARCVMEALEHVADEDVRRMVGQQIDASTLFSLGIGFSPQEPLTGSSGLTLIEFDRKLDLPERGKAAASYSRAERVSLAALRIVTRATLEILARSGGGVMMLDEAWTFLSSSEGMAALQALGREGRSQNILPVFATQRVADLLDNDLEGYLSRVFVMKLMEDREAAAALTLCGLQPSPERIAWLKSCGPKPPEEGGPGQPATALHRDLKNRHSAVLVTPVPEDARMAWSTNPEDRRRRAEEGLELLGDFDDPAAAPGGSAGEGGALPALSDADLQGQGSRREQALAALAARNAAAGTGAASGGAGEGGDWFAPQ